MVMAGGDTVTVQPTPLEPMPAMPMAARTMALIPIATATTPTVATDAFWFATNNHELGAGRLCPANTAMDIVSALASLVPVTEIGLLIAVARRRSGPWRCVSVSSGWDSRQQRRANVTQSVAARACERSLDTAINKLYRIF